MKRLISSTLTLPSNALCFITITKKQEQKLQKLVRFFKEYGYKHIGIEDNLQLNQTFLRNLVLLFQKSKINLNKYDQYKAKR